MVINVFILVINIRLSMDNIAREQIKSEDRCSYKVCSYKKRVCQINFENHIPWLDAVYYLYFDYL